MAGRPEDSLDRPAVTSRRWPPLTTLAATDDAGRYLAAGARIVRLLQPVPILVGVPHDLLAPTG